MSNPVYPTIKIEVKINNSWQSITSEVIGSQDVEYGFSGNDPTTRIASTGTFRFTLLNMNGKYTPGNPNCLNGWKKGIPVRLVISYTENFVKFSGWIDTINLNTRSNTVNVICTDWIDKAAKHQLKSPTMVFNKRSDEMAKLIVESVPVQPEYTIYNLGSFTFPTGFDTVTTKTTAISESNKLMLCEWGKTYLKNRRTTGNTLVVEGKTTNANATPTQLPTWDSFFMLEDGSGYYLLEDGSGYYCSETYENVTFTDNMMLTDFKNGENLINRTVITYHPKTVDSSPQVLFTWDVANQIYLLGLQTKVVTCYYTDPTGTSVKVVGKDMITPVAYTDYHVYGAPDNEFVELTMNVRITADFSNPSYAILTINNTQNIAGYIRPLQIRGTGVYFKEDATVTVEDAASISTYGDFETNIDMKYVSNQSDATAIAQLLIDQNKQPVTSIDSVEFLANTSDQLMRSFIYLDVGDLIDIEDTKSSVSGNFWITKMKFTIKQGGIIYFAWTLQQNLSVNTVYWELGTAGKSELGNTTIVY